MGLVKIMLEKETKKCIDSVDELVEEHIDFWDKKNSSTKVQDMISNEVPKNVLEKYTRLNAKLIFLNMLADRFYSEN